MSQIEHVEYCSFGCAARGGVHDLQSVGEGRRGEGGQCLSAVLCQLVKQTRGDSRLDHILRENRKSYDYIIVTHTNTDQCLKITMAPLLNMNIQQQS